MYHLIVVGNPDAYDGDPITLERRRALGEYTSAALSDRYSELTGDLIADLKRFPALFACEHATKTDARLGWITKIQVRVDAARFSYVFDDSFPPISWEQIKALEWDLDIDNYELNRTHWALKDVDLFDVLIENGQLPEDTPSPRQPGASAKRYRQDARVSAEVTPTVFRVPTEPRDPRLVSVMMPFDASLDQVYATIGNLCTELDLKCSRADDVFDESELIQDVFSLIYRSAVVICDFTGSNPNVYYEAGIAHTLGRPVVPLTQFDAHVTFDLKHHRFIQYLNNSQGLQELKPKLQRRLRRLLHLSTA